MYHMYILKSLKDQGYYIGYTKDLEKRMEYHNKGFSKATKHRLPIKLVYQECFRDKNSALKRESQLKRYKSRKYIEWLIEKNNSKSK